MKEEKYEDIEPSHDRQTEPACDCSINDRMLERYLVYLIEEIGRYESSIRSQVSDRGSWGYVSESDMKKRVEFYDQQIQRIQGRISRVLGIEDHINYDFAAQMAPKGSS